MRAKIFRWAKWLWAPAVMLACVQATGGADFAPDPPEGSLRAPEPPTSSSSARVSKPGDGVTWLAFPEQKSLSDASWGSMLTDIEDHLPASYGTTYRDDDKITWCHETSHGIHAHLRNNFNTTGKKANAFYVGNDQAVIVVEPNITKSQVAPFIPASLRASRFDTYITGQTEWDDTPLYVWDEWNAYVNGGACAVDLESHGLWTGGWRDGVDGQLEFTIYALAVAMAVEKYDPGYLASYPQFKEFLAWNARRAMTIFRQGRTMKDFAWDEQDAYYARIRTAPDAADLRAFATKLFGDAWVREVLYGDAVVPGDEDAGPPADAGPSVDSGPLDSGSFDTGVVDSGPIDSGPSVVDAGSDDGPLGSVDDEDQDGIPDGVDTCSHTPKGANVWRTGEWIGCAGGQLRDAGPWGGADSDGDGIADGMDHCTHTPKGQRVWTYGVWTGCAGGEHKDK